MVGTLGTDGGREGDGGEQRASVPCGAREAGWRVWCKEKNNRWETLQSATNGKVHCVAVDEDEEILVIGNFRRNDSGKLHDVKSDHKLT
ncbi:hypothetical protein MLD38_014347 [Melastoma candidum]|uniref:Uncharacterized protein n=1 Tax=Melastoma candidum TaxID=119954 RepID=A0ACB9RCF5_9MYRT|nr:hypothetical protein MLD38_014347 [Melastoma candidum]